MGGVFQNSAHIGTDIRRGEERSPRRICCDGRGQIAGWGCDGDRTKSGPFAWFRMFTRRGRAGYQAISSAAVYFIGLSSSLIRYSAQGLRVLIEGVREHLFYGFNRDEA